MKNKIRFSIFVTFALLFVAATAYAATSEAVMNEYYYHTYGSQYPGFGSPYAIPEGEGVVNETTGSLTTRVADYTIHGKNGMEIPFLRSQDTNVTGEAIGETEYDSKKDVADHYTVEYLCSNDNKVVDIEFKNKQEILAAGDSFTGKYYDSPYGDTYTYTGLVSDTGTVTYTKVTGAEPELVERESYYIQSLFSADTYNSFIKFRTNVKISIPSLTWYDSYEDSDENEVYYLFQDIYGNLNSIRVCYDKTGENKALDSAADGDYFAYCEYTFDVADRSNIKATAIHPDGFEYAATITSDDGMIYYLTSNSTYFYHVCAVEDRYGNCYLISSSNDEYTVTTPEGVVYTCNTSGITKTQNNVVTELVRYSGESVNTPEDIGDIYSEDDEYVFTITKNSGTGNTIAEDEENVIKYYMSQEYVYPYLLRNERTLRTFVPYRIELPNGVEKNIEYEVIDDWLVSEPDACLDGNYFAVSQYTENHGNDIRNKSVFEYTTNSYVYKRKTIYNYISETVREDCSNDDVVRTTTLTMDRYGRINEKEIANSSSTVNYDTYTYTYDGNDADSPIESETVEHTRSLVSKGSAETGSYTYYSYYYPKKETHGDYVVDYTYHTDGNYIPATIIYDKDANTEVKTENILTSDKKGIATTNVYENDELVQTTSYTYDIYGNVASQSVTMDDNNSIVTNYNYVYAPDGGYTLTTTTTGIKDADGTVKPDIVTVSVYDSDYNLVSQTDANGNTTTMTYDLLGKLLGTTYPDGTSETYTYNITDRITTYTAPNGTVYKAYFDSWGNRLKTTAFVDGAEIQFDEYTYDDLNNISDYKRFTSSADYTKASYTYDYLARPLTESVYNKDNTLLKTTTFAYDIAKDANYEPIYTTTSSVTGDGGTYASYSQSTNYRGFVTEEKSFTEDTERAYTYTYDYTGNVLTATDPAGNVTTTTYDALNRPLTVTYPDNTTVSTEYNGAGLVSGATDAMGNTTEYIYDNAGRNIKIVAPFDADSSSITKTYYDGNGNVISTKVLASGADEAESYRTVDNAYNSMNRLTHTAVYPSASSAIYTRYTYNQLGSPTKVVSGLSSATADDSTGQSVTYAYDSLGRMVQTTTPDSMTESAQYDLQGRVIRSTDKANGVTTFVYDNFDNLLSKSCGTESVSYTYNLLGLRTSMTDSTGTTNYAYSPYGELTQETKGDIIKSYTYDNLSRRTAMGITESDSNILSQTYAYDTMGRLTGTVNGSDILSYTYDANSNLLTKAHNGTVYHMAQYNKANLPIRTQINNGTDVEDVTNYIYNPDSNLARSSGTDISSMYYYDGANRLVYENTWTDNSGYIDEYTYNVFGNRTSKVHTDTATQAVTTTNYAYNSINQLTSQTNGADTVAYTYDAVGNMTEVTKNNEVQKQYTYDPFNRLATATVGGVTSSYTYNGDNLRQSKTVNGVATNHVYDDSTIVADLGASDKLYIRGAGLALFKDGTTTQVYGINPRGDVTKLISTDRTVADFSYTAYGEITSPATTTTNPFGYTGEYTDAETGLVYLRNRYYDPEIGIFITEDPAKDGINWYAYCAGNPVMFVDPWGLWEDGDENRTPQAQAYLKYYTKQWEEAENAYSNANNDFEKASAQDAMNKAHNNAVNIRAMDEKGEIGGVVLNVPIYNQYDTFPHDSRNMLCWATCQSMMSSYYLNDQIDRTQGIASYTRAHIEYFWGSPISYNEAFYWVSSDKLYYDLNENQVQYASTMSQKEIMDTIDEGNPFGVLYGAYYQDSNGSSFWSGHWILGIGYASAYGHEFIIVSNDPASGVQRIQNYSEFSTYVADMYPQRQWVQSAY